MILRTRMGNRELRFGESIARIPAPWQAGISSAGQTVTYDTAVGITAVGRAIRIVAGIGASMSIRTYTGRRGDRREVTDDWRSRMLENPDMAMSDFDWRYDIMASLEICENAFLHKIKDRKGLTELRLIPHQMVTARLNRDGDKEFVVKTRKGDLTFGSSDVLHIRGQTFGGGPFGVSRISQHRDPLGAMLAAQKFEGAFYRNNARPDLAVIFPQGVTKAQANEWREEWSSNYGGPENAGKPMPLGGGATIQPIPVSMQDAQFIQGKELSILDVGRIMDVDPVMLGVELNRDARASAVQHFLHIQLPPRLRRVERAFRADPDFFGTGTLLYPEFEVNELMFADPLTRAQVQHFRVQDGTELVDEARADNGRPPLPPVPDDPSQEPGKVPQITPVGGAVALPMPTQAENLKNSGAEAANALTVPSLELRLEQDLDPLAREIGLHLEESRKRDSQLVALMLERDETREKREQIRASRADEVGKAQAEALRAVGTPNITVNVEPTPITVENTIDVQPASVQLTLVEDEAPTNLDIEFKRHQNGTIKSAKVTDA